MLSAGNLAYTVPAHSVGYWFSRNTGTTPVGVVLVKVTHTESQVFICMDGLLLALHPEVHGLPRVPTVFLS